MRNVFYVTLKASDYRVGASDIWSCHAPLAIEMFGIVWADQKLQGPDIHHDCSASEDGPGPVQFGCLCFQRAAAACIEATALLLQEEAAVMAREALTIQLHAIGKPPSLSILHILFRLQGSSPLRQQTH